MNLWAFLAHPKATDDATIDLLRDAATKLMHDEIARAGGGAVPTIVTGRDDFNERAMACGGWLPWVESVALGNGYRNGVLGPLFDLLIVTPEPVIGKATAQMVNMALSGAPGAAPRPVFFMPHPSAPDAGRLYPVTGLRVRDANNYVAGHTLVFSQPI